MMIPGKRISKRTALAAAALVMTLAASRPGAFAADQASAVTDATASHTLVVATYNIHSGVPLGHSSFDYSTTPHDIHNIADVLTTMGADLVALQEVRNEWGMLHSEEKFNAAPIDIARLLSGYLDMHFAFGSTINSLPGYPSNTEYLEWGTFTRWTNNGRRHGEYGNAVLSRLPLLEPPVNFAIPSRPRDEQRGCLRVALAHPTGALGQVIVYATHLQSNHAPSRRREMKTIVDHAKLDAGTSTTVFIMGDLNTFPHPGEPDVVGVALKAGFHDLAAEWASDRGTSAPLTIPSDTPKRRIDYILCSRPLVVEKVVVPDTQVSDHRPVAITIRTDRLP